MREEAILPQFEALFRHTGGGTAEHYKKLRQDSWSPGRDLRAGQPEFEARLLTSWR
jgi:hypothetical protein